MVDLLLIRGNIFTPIDDGKPKTLKRMDELASIEDGAIAVKDGVIVDIGKTDDLFKKHRDTKNIVDANFRAVLPGFVDPHTHALFVGTREKEFDMRLAGKSYMEILNAGGGILNSVKRLRSATIEQLRDELKKRIKTFFEYGTTTLEVKSGYGLDFENEIKMLTAIALTKKETPMDIAATFIGAHAIPEEFKDKKEEYVKLVVERMIPYIAEHKLAEFVDVFCEEGVYTPEETLRIIEAGLKHSLKAKIHADEIASIGCSELALKTKLSSCDHLLKIKESGIEALKQSGTMATLLPITAFSLKEEFADGRRLVDSGVGVALATDFNPGSSYSESMPFAITLAVLNMGLTPREAIVASTLNSAYVLGREKLVGSLEVGKQADFVLLKENSYLFIPYHAGVNPIYAVYKRGERVFSAGC
ncbi:imidazolonepropionase [Hippea maritima]|uniref:Imidazolonepropionase n=1 Tax=Hippea maritima (strain ATCC 700847 / DSM 10411 / MH2) TaxID=760142 RepID=F2LUI3_HIPMA|nr:imidazolonepropionase [Hippea maritima]AEA34573.1 Imidazolonepropionase [Hippea maritima DSM 10411]